MKVHRRVEILTNDELTLLVAVVRMGLQMAGPFGAGDLQALWRKLTHAAELPLVEVLNFTAAERSLIIGALTFYISHEDTSPEILINKINMSRLKTRMGNDALSKGCVCRCHEEGQAFPGGTWTRT